MPRARVFLLTLLLVAAPALAGCLENRPSEPVDEGENDVAPVRPNLVGRLLDNASVPGGDAADGFHTSDLPASATGAVSFWVRPAETPAASWLAVTPVDDCRGLEAQIDAARRMSFHFFDAACAPVANVTTDPLPAGAWTHVAIDWGHLGQANAWVDGDVVATAAVTGLDAWVVGRLEANGTAQGVDLADVRLWDGPLTVGLAAELAAAPPAPHDGADPAENTQRARPVATVASPDPLDLGDWAYAPADPNATGRGAVAFWLRPADTPPTGRDFLRVNTTGPCPEVHVNLQPDRRLIVAHPDTTCPDPVELHAEPLSGETWVHVVVNWEAGDRMSLWLDGAQVASGDYPARTDGHEVRHVIVGHAPGFGHAYNVTLWDRPLSETRIRDAATNPPPDVSREREPEPAEPTEPGLIAWWPLDRAYDEENTFLDAVGDAPYGKKAGTPRLVQTQDGEGYALNRDGYNENGTGSFLYLANGPGRLPYEGTLRWRVYVLDTADRNATLVASRDDACTRLHAWTTPEGDLSFVVRPDCAADALFVTHEPGLFPVSGWVNVTLTWDWEHTRLAFGDPGHAMHLDTPLPRTEGYLTFGAVWNDADPERGRMPLRGMVDDIRLYGRVLDDR